MQRISTADAAANLFGAGKNGFTDGNQVGGINATQLNAEWFNGSQEELCNIIELCGITLSASTRTQLASAIQTGKLIGANAAGSANALTASFNPAITTLVDGMILVIRAAAANTTTAPTLAVGAIAAKTIMKGNNIPLAVGDIIGAGHRLVLVYDATFNAFALQNPATGLRSSRLMAASGYKIMDDGTIMQWAVGSSEPSNLTEPAQVISWPIPFPTACIWYSVTTCISAPDTGSDHWYQIVDATPTSLLTSIQVQRQHTPGATGGSVTTSPRVMGIGY